MSYASEAGHWYDQAGEPCYEIEKAGGGLRPTTLRDARKLNLVPSVTGVMRELAAPQLELWKIKQAVMMARQMRKRKHETEEQFAMRAYNESQQQVRDRATDGTFIHAALEQYFLGEEFSMDYLPHVQGVVHALEQLGLDKEPWKAEKSFSFNGFGGKVDLHSPNLIADFKTKEFTEDNLPNVYDNHFMQLGAYRAGLQLGNVGGLILFVSSESKGLVHPVECTPEQLDKGYAMFLGLLQVWQAKRGYFPTNQGE